MACSFEAGDVGGRTQTFTVNGSVYEMGASIIHQQNSYFRYTVASILSILDGTPSDNITSRRHLADAMGLERQAVGSDSGQVAIYDGRSFVFRESPWTLVTLCRMLWRQAPTACPQPA